MSQTVEKFEVECPRYASENLLTTEERTDKTIRNRESGVYEETEYDGQRTKEGITTNSLHSYINHAAEFDGVLRKAKMSDTLYERKKTPSVKVRKSSDTVLYEPSYGKEMLVYEFPISQHNSGDIVSLVSKIDRRRNAIYNEVTPEAQRFPIRNIDNSQTQHYPTQARDQRDGRQRKQSFYFIQKRGFDSRYVRINDESMNEVVSGGCVVYEFPAKELDALEAMSCMEKMEMRRNALAEKDFYKEFMIYVREKLTNDWLY